MFDKNAFANILKNINDTYPNQRDLANQLKLLNRTYISKYINLKLDNPPRPEVLKELAENSRGITTYEELMVICGYIEEHNKNFLKSFYSNINSIKESLLASYEGLNLSGLDEDDIQEIKEYIDFKRQQKKK